MLSGSYDRRAIIWNPATGAIVKTLLLHDAPVFDVDWKDDDVFATCSSDKTILICSVNSKEPHALKTLTGHTDEVSHELHTCLQKHIYTNTYIRTHT